MSTALAASVANGIRIAGEALTLRQLADGTFNVSTQTRTPGAATNTETVGLVELVEKGIDGVTVKSGDLNVWLPKLELDGWGVTPVIGNYILRGSQELVVLEVETGAVAGYYRCRSRAAG